MVYRSESFVLRKYDLTESSFIVHFFSREKGLLKLVAKGAKRAKSPFSGSLEIFNRVEIEYSKKEHSELGTLRKIDLVESAFSLFSDYKISKTLFAVSETLSKGMKEEQKEEEVYRLASAVIESLKLKSPPEWVLNYFFAWFLKLNGVFPAPNFCGGCGAKENFVAFNSEKGGFLCAKCFKGEGFALKGESISTIKEILKTHPSKLVGKQDDAFPKDLQNMLYLKVQDFLGSSLKSI
ncbi:MAG: DNA repair protein RecO [Acidobacteria bacterium]|nr:DNA repair protein RecO [Acidobacteriota bacterium]